MPLETLLTELSFRGDRLRLSLREGGEVLLNYHHVFPTKAHLSLNRSQIAEIALKWNKKTQNLKYWPLYGGQILQVSASKSLAKELPEAFIKGHYLEQARWRIAAPFSQVTVGAQLAEVLEKKLEVDSLFIHYAQRIREENASKSSAYQNQRANLVWKEIARSILPFSPEKKKQLSTLEEEAINRIKERLSNLPVLKGVNYAYGNGRLDIILDKQHHQYLFLRFGSCDLAEKKDAVSICYIDIEEPFFDTPEEEISWICQRFVKGKERQNEIYTIRKTTPLRENSETQIFNYPSERDCLAAVTEEINSRNPHFLIAYNAPFDLIEIREAEEEGFLIGARESGPKKEVSKDTFLRVAVAGRQVLDLLRFSRFAYPFLPNHRLETVAKFLGLNFTKSLNYNQLAAEERKAVSGDLSAADKIASYVGGDVAVMEEIIKKTNLLEVVSLVCRFFSIEPYKAVYSQEAVDDWLKRYYFKQVGTYETDTRFFSKENQEKHKDRKTLAQKTKYGIMLPGGNKPGLYRGVSYVYLPWADHLKEIFAGKDEFGSSWNVNKAIYQVYKFIKEKHRQFITSEKTDADLWKQYLWSVYGGFFADEMFYDLARGVKDNVSYAKYGLSLHDLEMKLNQVGSRMAQKISAVGGEILWTDGDYAVVQRMRIGKSGVISLIRNLDVLITDKPIYSLCGEYAGVDAEEGEDFFSTPFERRVLREVLDKSFAGSGSELSEIVKLAREELRSGQVINEELFFYNKKQKRYSTYEVDSKKRFIFSMEAIPPVAKYDVERDLYYTEEERTKKDGKIVRQRIYFDNGNHCQPSQETFDKRIFSLESRLGTILLSLWGEERTRDFLENEQEKAYPF